MLAKEFNTSSSSGYFGPLLGTVSYLRRPGQRTLTIGGGGKYHCTTNLLFDWFGFDQTIKTVVHST